MPRHDARTPAPSGSPGVDGRAAAHPGHPAVANACASSARDAEHRRHRVPDDAVGAVRGQRAEPVEDRHRVVDVARDQVARVRRSGPSARRAPRRRPRSRRCPRRRGRARAAPARRRPGASRPRRRPLDVSPAACSPSARAHATWTRSASLPAADRIRRRRAVASAGAPPSSRPAGTSPSGPSATTRDQRAAPRRPPSRAGRSARPSVGVARRTPRSGSTSSGGSMRRARHRPGGTGRSRAESQPHRVPHLVLVRRADLPGRGDVGPLLGPHQHLGVVGVKVAAAGGACGENSGGCGRPRRRRRRWVDAEVAAVLAHRALPVVVALRVALGDAADGPVHGDLGRVARVESQGAAAGLDDGARSAGHAQVDQPGGGGRVPALAEQRPGADQHLSAPGGEEVGHRPHPLPAGPRDR